MDPGQLFSDERFDGMCVYCGAPDTTGDHVPSKVLLDEPYPNNLPKVPACQECNNLFSADEPYLACLIECALTGTVDPALVRREKIRRILTERPHFGVQILAGRREENGTLLWAPDEERVRNVVLKLVQGHVAYELGEPRREEPESFSIAPLCALNPHQRDQFEIAPEEAGWPELGSRAFLRTLLPSNDVIVDQGWLVVQPGRYRYLVAESHGPLVRVVLSEYLACEAVW